MNEVTRIASDFQRKDRAALSRVLSWVERSDSRFQEFLPLVADMQGGHTHVVGLTGPPGAGKSSMVNNLLLRWDADKEVAVLAIDPSNERTMGALLADRARFDHGNYRAFMRSVGSRGTQGGLSARAAQMLLVMDLFGFDVVILETVGSGQSDVAISHLAETTVLLEVPGLGDSFQADKAGILDFADIIVVNKADLPGADTVHQNIHLRLHFSKPKACPTRLLKCSVNDDDSLDRLCDAIAEHRQFMLTNPVAEEIQIDKFLMRMKDQFISGIQEQAEEFFNTHTYSQTDLYTMRSDLLRQREVLRGLKNTFYTRISAQ